MHFFECALILASDTQFTYAFFPVCIDLRSRKLIH